MNPRLIGGEMLLWSDLAGATGPARGAALAALLAPHLSGRTLVAGPHDPALLSTSLADATVPTEAPTLLLRGVPDAEALADRFPVLCGGPAKLASSGDPGWDTIVALDGLGRLGSVEDPEQTWAETLDQLLAVLRPGGTLLLGLENLFGLNRLVSIPPPLTDADWTPAADYDETRPASLAAARKTLQAAGLTLQQTLATFPSPTAPAALIDTAVLTDRPRRGYLEALLTSTSTPGDDVLADPRRLAINALRHEAAADLAPGWILIAKRAPISSPSPAPTTSVQPTPAAPGQPSTTTSGQLAPTTPMQPSTTISERPTPQPAAVPEQVVSPPAAISERPASRGSAEPDPDRIVVYRSAGTTQPAAEQLTTADIPVGDSLESLLLAAALRRDLPRIRTLLTLWQSGPASAVPAAEVVVAPDGSFLPLASPGTPASALHAFAVTVLSGGFAHPWPSPASAADLTVTLATMTGIDLDPATIPPETPRPSLQDLIADRDRLTRELTEARTKHDFYERTIADRDRALVRARQINALLSTTKPAKALLAGARVARSTIRRFRG